MRIATGAVCSLIAALFFLVSARAASPTSGQKSKIVVEKGDDFSYVFETYVGWNASFGKAYAAAGTPLKQLTVKKCAEACYKGQVGNPGCDSFVYRKSTKLCSFYTGAMPAGFNDFSDCLTWTKSADYISGALYADDDLPDHDLVDRSC